MKDWAWELELELDGLIVPKGMLPAKVGLIRLSFDGGRLGLESWPIPMNN
jgi:hypothetical protein